MYPVLLPFSISKVKKVWMKSQKSKENCVMKTFRLRSVIFPLSLFFLLFRFCNVINQLKNYFLNSKKIHVLERE